LPDNKLGFTFSQFAAFVGNPNSSANVQISVPLEAVDKSDRELKTRKWTYSGKNLNFVHRS